MTDIRPGLLRALPAPLQPYALLIRLDRPVGIFLLLFPAWFAIALHGAPHQLPDLGLMLLFFIGAIAMRGAGCIVNDLFDQKLDQQVARTASRPLAAGTISRTHAIIFACLLTLIGFLVALSINPQTVLLAAASLPLIIIYPLMKRFTWWPQAFLALVFNWGALLGCMAVTGSLSLATLTLYVACFFWTLAYDTVYAFQDIQDDEKAGIKSTARRLGDKAKLWVAVWYAQFILLAMLAGALAGLGFAFYVGAAVAGLEIAHHTRNWKLDNAESSLKGFRSNTLAGWIMLAAILMGKLL